MIVVSNVKEVRRFNPKRPKVMEIVFDSATAPSMDAYAEFDTVESAREWRKELQGLSIALASYARRFNNIQQALYISTDTVGAKL